MAIIRHIIWKVTQIARVHDTHVIDCLNCRITEKYILDYIWLYFSRTNTKQLRIITYFCLKGLKYLASICCPLKMIKYIKAKAILPEAQVTLDDSLILFMSFGLLTPKDLNYLVYQSFAELLYCGCYYPPFL